MRLAAIGALAVAVLMGASACGGGSSNSTAKQTAEITTAYTSFFNASTPAATRLASLQNGANYTPQLTQLGKLMPSTLGAKVDSVAITGNTAAVTYELINNGQSLLGKPSTGSAVKVGGKWLVASSTFCGLASLAGAACSG
jgi:ABC-type phosphate/phosphonate transport system substrate-binding protein